MTSKISSSMVLTCRQFIRAATISTHNNRLLRLTFQLVPSFCQIDRRNFHSSVPLSFAKSQKGGKKKGGRDDADDDNDSEPKASASLPDIKTYDSLMEKRLDRLVEEFDKLRVGRPSADMLNHIVVDAHGARMRITELGQILMKNQSTISISVFDPAHVSAVAAAIRQDSNMNLNPNADGNTVIVNVPKPSKESRDTFIKAAAKSADKAKNEVRNIRKDALDSVKKLKNLVSEDDVRKLTKEIDALTEKKIEKVTKMLKDKESKLIE